MYRNDEKDELTLEQFQSQSVETAWRTESFVHPGVLYKENTEMKSFIPTVKLKNINAISDSSVVEFSLRCILSNNEQVDSRIMFTLIIWKLWS